MDKNHFDQLHNDCAAYLKSHETSRIMKGLLDKYKSYGAVMGTLSLSKPTANESLFLQGLLKKKVTAGITIRISLKSFEEAFSGTIYEGISLPTLLEVYFDRPIESKRESTNKAYMEKQNFVMRLRQKLENQRGAYDLNIWISEALFNPQHRAYSLMNGLYQADSVNLEALLLDLESLLHCIEEHEGGIGIPMAAGIATGNPHALDRGMPLRKLLIYFTSECRGLDVPITLHETDAFLEQLNLNVDETQRLVLTYGLDAYDALGLAYGWQSFYDRNEPLSITPQNLRKVMSLKAVTEKVWCYENPSTFFRSVQKSPKNAAICISGQPNLVVYKVLDKLAETHQLIYSGDFDPEGLLIANRLKNRYAHLDLSFFSESNYIQALSNETVSETRLKQLDQLSDATLKIIATLLRRYKRAGYEERANISGSAKLFNSN